MRPAELAEEMMGIMLARDHLLEDVNYNKIVPNRYVIELSQANYDRNYHPIEERIIKQWIGKLLNFIMTTNSRLGRKEYRLGGPLTLEIRPVPTLDDTQARILFCIQAESGTIQAPAALHSACLELMDGSERWHLGPGLTTIGRDQTCLIHLTRADIQEKRLVSGQHAYIRTEETNWRIFDGSLVGKPSTNGTYVNDIAVSPEGTLLQDDDRVILAALDPDHPTPDTPGVAAFIFKRDCA